MKIDTKQLGKMAAATRRDERLLEKIEQRATADDMFDTWFDEAALNAEIGRLRVDVAALKVEVDHWKNCAVKWEREAKELRERLTDKKRRQRPTSSTLTLDADDIDGRG